MKLTDHENLKHYVGNDVTICFQHKEEQLTITGMLVSYDAVDMTIKLKESILYEIGLEKVEYYSMKGFDELTELDCCAIIKAIHGTTKNWKIKRVEDNQITLSNMNNDIPLSEYQHALFITRTEDNCINICNIFDDRLNKKETYGLAYMKLLSLGYAIR